MSTIVDWLRSAGLEQYTDLFVENEIDLATLAILTDDDLKELGLPFGPRKRILKALAEPERKQEEGERRQLTVLFCDMAGFTEMAVRLDPEVLRGIVQQYEQICTTCVERYEGHVFQRLGDGIVAFFGYPVADERDAERAILTGLDIVEALRETRMEGAGRLSVRVGIATGMVVVAPGTAGAIGETTNLASRLQGIAPLGGVVVSERVYRLTATRFCFDDLGELHLKGIEKPCRAYRVSGIAAAPTLQTVSSRLIGRQVEIDMLAGKRQLAFSGEGQVVLLSGEPGIGKSRILHAIRESWERDGVRRGGTRSGTSRWRT
jgi:class 3 adenylate cyclase